MTVTELNKQFPDSNFYLFGDYNLPLAAWKNGPNGLNLDDSTSLFGSEKEAALIVHESYSDFFQLNCVRNVFGAMLDLCFAINDSSLTTIPPENILHCDVYHPALQLQLPASVDCNIDLSYNNTIRYNFRKGDYASLNGYLSQIDWATILNSLNVGEAVATFYSYIYSAIDRFVPVYKKIISTYPKWYTPQLRRLIHSKKRAHARYKLTNCLCNYFRFSQLRADCKKLTCECYHSYISSVESLIPTYTKAFWAFVKSKKNTSVIPQCMHLANVTVDTGSSIANLFADYFRSVYTTSTLVTHSDCKRDGPTDISALAISILDIKLRLATLDVNKGPGDDSIPPIFITNYSAGIALPLSVIFNLSLFSGFFPLCWKSSLVTPIYESGGNADISNYRPISILNASPKLFESIVTDKLAAVVSMFIINEQHGFIPGRSSTTNVVLFTNYILSAFKMGRQVDAVYTDFSKAFDLVCHNILIHKLYTFRIRRTLLSWLSSYLTDRTQAVRVNDFLSYTYSVSSGVPQGSHLGPLLFTIFMNDISLLLCMQIFIICGRP